MNCIAPVGGILFSGEVSVYKFRDPSVCCAPAFEPLLLSLVGTADSIALERRYLVADFQ
jgi:hypothetical protein